MVYIKNDHFDLHIRTEHRGRWSAIVASALRFDNDILEVMNINEEEFSIKVNGEFVNNNNENAPPPNSLDGIYPLTVTNDMKKVTVTLSGGQFIEYMQYFNSTLIRIAAHGSDFYESAGMAGAWDKIGLVGRDGTTTFNQTASETALFAAEWEVNEALGDPILFSTLTQNSCMDGYGDGDDDEVTERPTIKELQRAAHICRDVFIQDDTARIQACMFDALIINDEEVGQNPAYTNPLKKTKRCVESQESQESQESASESESESESESLPRPNSNGLLCSELGGECVYRCDHTNYECIEGALCEENVALEVVDLKQRSRRRMEFIEGCSYAVRRRKGAVASSSPSIAPSVKPSNDEKPSFPYLYLVYSLGFVIVVVAVVFVVRSRNKKRLDGK